MAVIGCRLRPASRWYALSRRRLCAGVEFGCQEGEVVRALQIREATRLQHVIPAVRSVGALLAFGPSR
jgi:hypothetical protein